MTRPQWLPRMIIGLVFLLILGLYLYNITGWFKEDDEGTALYAAWRLAEGETPYQDFITTKGPLFLLLGAGLNRVLGPSILSLRAVTALAVISSGYCWYRGLRAVYGPPAGAIGAVVFLLTPEVYHLGRLFRADSWMLALVACALSACLLGCRWRKYRWFLLSGSLFGLAILIKVIAALPFLGCALFLIFQTLPSPRRREVLVFAIFTASFLTIAVTGFGLAERVTPGTLGMILGSQGTLAKDSPNWVLVVIRGLVVYAAFIRSNLVIILAIPFALLVVPTDRRMSPGLCFLCQVLAASVLLLLPGAVYPRYLAYTVLGLSGLFAMGIKHFLDQIENRSRYGAVGGLVLLGIAMSLLQMWVFLTRSETGTMTLATYIAENTAPDDVILGDYAELAFHARRRSVPQTGGIAYNWAVSGLITGKELIQTIEQHDVSLIALHVPGGPEPPGHLYYLQDWDAFYQYVREHYQAKEQMVRAGQLFEIYHQGRGE